MIIIDTETTGLLIPSSADLKMQPRIVELCAVRLDPEYQVLAEHVWLINPQLPIPPEVTKIHGIKDSDVQGQPTFEELLPEISRAFLGATRMYAHNLPFDRGMLEIELRRCDAVTRFPWPPEQICTVALTEHLFGHSLKLTELSQKLLKLEYKQTHRAQDDVKVLCDIIRHEQW